MTGFRVAYGGAQSVYGVTPDLTTLGKIVGGGMPLGAYGGRIDLMDQILPSGKVFQAGTLSGNPLATAAGAATLKTAARCTALSATGTTRCQVSCGAERRSSIRRHRASYAARRQHDDALLCR